MHSNYISYMQFFITISRAVLYESEQIYNKMVHNMFIILRIV